MKQGFFLPVHHRQLMQTETKQQFLSEEDDP